MASTYWIEYLIEIEDEGSFDPTDSNNYEDVLKGFYFWLIERGVIPTK